MGLMRLPLVSQGVAISARVHSAMESSWDCHWFAIQMGTSTKRILSVIIRNTVCENTERTLCLNS